MDHRRLWLLVLGGLVLGSEGRAQIATDGTLGPALSFAGSDIILDSSLGQRAGGNLFHSFRDFNLAAGQRALFTGDPGISHVISRVTGGRPSAIDGTIASAIPGADHWFVNPAGITFGANARLDVSGSFHASTADQVHFADGTRFDARGTTSGALLSVAAPESFGFLDRPRGPISVEGAVLGPGLNSTLSLSAPRIDLEPGTTLLALGQIALNGAGPNTVVAPGWSEGGVRAGDIRLEDATVFAGDGAVVIRGGQLELASSSVTAASFDRAAEGIVIEGIEIGITDTIIDASAAPTSNVDAGSVVIDGRTVDLAGPSTLIRSQSGIGGSGQGGDITLEAVDLQLRDGATVFTNARGSERSGDITLRVSRSATVEGGNISVGTFPGSTGAGGTLRLEAPLLTLDRGSQVTSSTSSTGAGGTIVVEGGTLQVRGASRIDATSFGAGAGGDVVIRTSEAVSVEGFDEIGDDIAPSSISAGAAAGGQGGRVRISTPVLTVADNGFINAISLSEAASGSLLIDVDELQLTRNGTLSADALGTGDGGDVTVEAQDLIRVSGGSISTGTLLDGTGGRLRLEAPTIRFTNGAFIESGAVGDGPGGAIEITAGQLVMTDSFITVSSGGAGNAGDLAIRIGNELRLTRSIIGSGAIQAGGGRITIAGGDLALLDESVIASSVLGDPTTTAGDLLIDSTFLVLNESAIGANAAAGQGGNIQINVDTLFSSPGSTIDASAETGIDGTVNITGPESDIADQLVALEGSPIDASSLIRSPCGARGRAATSSLAASGRGGIAPAPDQALIGYTSGAFGGMAVRPAAAALPSDVFCGDGH